MSEIRSNGKQKKNLKEKNMLLRVSLFVLIFILTMFFIVYIYDFRLNYITLMFMILLPLIITPLFLFKDLMHPFNIFLMSTQFLFILNMIDLNANKETFRYGILESNYHNQAFFWAVLVVILWYLFMYLGYIYSRKSKIKPLKTSRFIIYNSTIIAIILILIGILSFLYIVFLKGGFLGIIDGLSGRVEAYAGLIYYIKLTGFVTIGSLMLLGNGYKKTSLILIVISFLMLASFGGRAGAFFGSIFPYLVYYHYQVKEVKIIKLIPLGIITILFAIGLGNYRLYEETRIELSGFYDILTTIASGTEGGEILPSLIGSLIRGNIDYQYGSTLINIIFAPIPSSIWSNKPQIDETGIVGKALMGSDFWGLPPGPYGIAFYNFGFIGVILIGFLVGYIVWKLYYKFIVSEKKNKLGLVFYVLIITSVFNFISTSAQINLLWYLGVFIFIKILDLLINSFKRNIFYKRY